VEDAPNLHSRVRMRVRSVARCHQDASLILAQLAYLGGVVVSVAQNEASLLAGRQLFEQLGGQAAIGLVGGG
jgi:hypothetical protein